MKASASLNPMHRLVPRPKRNRHLRMFAVSLSKRRGLKSSGSCQTLVSLLTALTSTATSICQEKDGGKRCYQMFADLRCEICGNIFDADFFVRLALPLTGTLVWGIKWTNMPDCMESPWCIFMLWRAQSDSREKKNRFRVSSVGLPPGTDGTFQFPTCRGCRYHPLYLSPSVSQ